MKKKFKNAIMDNRWKSEIWRTILNIFRPYNGIDVLKLLFLEELYEKTFVVPYVYYTVPNHYTHEKKTRRFPIYD